MAKFKIINEGDSFYTIKDLPIFAMHTDRGFPCDEKWMAAAIANHMKYKKGGYRPTIIIGHNVKGREKEAVGFLDNLVLKGKHLYADLVRVPKAIKEKIVQNAFPSRSVEVLPGSKRVLTLALLGGTTPHFPLPQMSYEQNENETLWFRSPEMELTEEMKTEIYSQVSAATAETLGQVFGTDTEDDGGEVVEFTHPETGETYAIPAVLAATLAKLKGAGAVASHVGKATAAGGKASAALGLGKSIGKAAGRQVGQAGRFIKQHPRGAAAAAGAGIAAGRASKKSYALEGYTINDETGEVLYDGQPLGVVVTYEEMKEVGMTVPTAVKKPQALPKVQAADPQLEISAADVGIDTGIEPAAQTSPGAIAGDVVQPLDREESDQFAVEELAAQNYELHQRLEQVETANALITEGRRAQEYTKWLEDQRTAGVPIGDVEQMAAFMMSLSPEQVEEHKLLLESQPKVAFERAEQTMTFAEPGQNEAAIKADYTQNKDIYQAMGVRDEDLKYVQYVRSNRAVGEVQS